MIASGRRWSCSQMCSACSAYSGNILEPILVNGREMEMSDCFGLSLKVGFSFHFSGQNLRLGKYLMLWGI